jgi:hypothetical protein
MVADRVDHGVRIIAQGRRVVVTRQIRRHCFMAALLQLSLYEMPIPAHITGAMDQRECGHLVVTSSVAPL